MSIEKTLIADSPTDEPGAGTATPGAPEAPAAPEQAPSPPETAAGSTPVRALDSAELEALQARAAKADENRDRYLRTAADFENFKKRAARERQEGIRLANEALLGRLLPVLDNFEMALASNTNPAAGGSESFRAGVAMIHGQLRHVLSEAGLEEVDATGQPFNPNLHEAVAQRDSTEVAEGQVLQQLRMGYKYRERLLRPASVVVARAPTKPPETALSATEANH
jgi:molecular chaperone GrpE